MTQRTIAEKATCTGVGLHSGGAATVSLFPARPGTGVVFVRSDLETPAEIPARRTALASTRLATTLGRGEATIGTVEHLLAAVSASGIDNLRVEVDGPEIPVMDGSAAPFLALLAAAGTFDQRVARRVIRIRKPIALRDGDRAIRVTPAPRLTLTYFVEYPHAAIGKQRLDALAIDAASFERELASARTFGFLQEVEALRRGGLARGGSLDNTVVLDEQRVLNPGGLRFADEFVRHKALDLIGDLALLGMPLLGHVEVERGGHALHQQLVERILATPEVWAIETSYTPALPQSDEDLSLAATA
ncbi:MAG: UDP-3-O-acyl-N-acetylglucosamine deacetylase [Deltaproteobacteria bacterium]|nr:UDP-3-O-acyl-N-acetylglucosamine deacetylase [Deltaproteobacteria bacterium]